MYAQRQATTPANPPVVEITVQTSLRRSLSSSSVVETRIRTAFRDIGGDQVPTTSRELTCTPEVQEPRLAGGLPDRS